MDIPEGYIHAARALNEMTRQRVIILVGATEMCAG
jgi:hypothetical protein